MKDLIAELDRVRRRVGSDGPEHVVELQRRYEAPITDVWDACTDPERIPRWFLPVTGDLRLGGRFQLEGNAGGTITECEPPRRLSLTWESRGAASVVILELTPTGAATELRLRHVVGDDDHWATYGPGAVGVGWDLTLLGLAHHLGGGATLGQDVLASPEWRDVTRRSAAGWGAADAEGGTAATVAREAADRTSAAYVPQP
jgi:uncharacterized protein YndB with AHSA1/START domain